MSEPKLLELIRAFSPAEKETFPLFLNSPFFVRESQSGDMLRLYQCLSLAASDPATGLPDKPGLHTAVFPDKPFSDARLERTLTKFGQLAEQFLSIRYYQSGSNDLQRQLDLVTVYREKQLAPVFEKKLQKLKSATAAKLKESSANYLFRYRLAREEHERRCTFNPGKSNLHIPELIEQLDLFYRCERTEMLNRFLLQQLVGSLKTPDPIRRALEPLPDQDYFEQQSPLLRIRQLIRDLFLKKDPDKADFDVLMELLKNHEHDIAPGTLPELYAFLRNLGVLTDFNGKAALKKAMHEIHKDNLERGYFYQDGQIAPYSLVNITRIALIANNIPWARQFIEAHRNRILTDQDPDEIINMGLALCLFAEKKYAEALAILPFIARYPQLILTAKRLELMIYYELGSDLLSYKIDAFRKFLERTASKNFSGVQRRLNLNFVNLLQQLINTALKDAGRSARLTARIHQKKPVGESLWLLEKAGELA